MDIKKIIGKIHLWLGIASGLVVFVLGLTGCIYAFEEEIKALVYRGKLEVFAHGHIKPLFLSKNLQAAQEKLRDDLPISGIIVKNTPESSLIFKHYKGKEDTEGIWFWDGIASNLSVYVNPYTSEIIHVEDTTFEFFNMVLWLHWSLLLKNDIGQPIVGVATLVFIIMLITGLVLWWPKNRAAKRQRVWFRWKRTTKWKRKNYDLHNILGFYSMFFALVVALTGLVWAFDWFNSSVQWMVNGGETIEREKEEITSMKAPVASDNPLDLAHSYLRSNHKQAKQYYFFLPQDSLSTITSVIAYEDITRNVSLKFDRYSGELLYTNGKWEDKSNGEKVRAYNYDIHTGAIGGLVGKTIAFFLSLFAASLPVTGFLIWYGRTFKKLGKRPKPRKGPVVLRKPA
mgnify:CR=1 FL=1